MFRRKDEVDSLFDNAADPQASSVESATVISSPAGASAAGASASSAGASAAAHTPAQASAIPPSRPATPDPRPAGAQTASAFRPNTAPLGGDLSRSRLPEAKNTLAASPISASSAATHEKGLKGGRRVLTVGNDILLKGEIATCDRLVIEGKVDATLNDVHTVEIAESGSFKGSAQIEDAEISGIFDGDLVVRNRLVIYATGKVRGKISYGEIEIERGGELTGEIKTTGGQQTASGRPSRAASLKESKFEAA